MTGNSTRSDASQSLFVYVKDQNTDVIRRVAITADTQVGLESKPAELQLFGRLSLASSDNLIDASNNGFINVSNHDTIVTLRLDVSPTSGRINVRLPPTPRDGQLHFIKDVSGTAATIPIDVVPDTGKLIDGASIRTMTDAHASLLIAWVSGEWHVLSAPSTSSGGGASTSASYVTVTSESGLPNSRVITAGTGLLSVDGGAGSSLSLNINDGIVATLSGSRFLGTVRAAGGLSGSLQRQDDGTSYLVAGSGVTIVSQSNGQIVISASGSTPASSLPVVDHLFIVAGTQVVDQVVFQAIGAFEFNPTGIESMAPSGSVSYSAYFQPIVEVFPTGVTLETQLYNVGINSYVVGSLLSCSLLGATRLKSDNLSGSLSTGSNTYEMHMRITNARAGKAICKGAKLFVTWQ